MEHSTKYESVKDFYNKGLWNEYRVQMAVEKGWITEEEKTIILAHSK